MAITRLLTESLSHRASWVVSSTPVDTQMSYLTSINGLIQYGSAAGLISSEGMVWTLDSSIAQTMISVCISLPVGGPVSSDTPSMITLGDGGLGTKALTIYYDAGTWEVYAGATQLGSFADTILYKDWVHWGIDFKIDASAGWCNIYFNGVAQLTYSGQTNQGASTFDTVCLGPDAANDNWNAWIEFVNFVMDDSTGEGAAAQPPLVILRPLNVADNGNYSDWTGQDGNQVNNYQMVDDSIAQGSVTTIMSTYVVSATSGHQDSYQIADPHGAISGYGYYTDATNIAAVWETIIGIEEAGTTEQFKPFLRYSGTDLDGTPIDLSTSNMRYKESFPTPPGGGTWTEAIFSATEAGVEVV